jgi:ribosome biogenesis GTPase
MIGRIVKGIAGFYYVHVAGSGIYECKAKGIFRKEKIKPLVGDRVQIAVIDESEKTGNVEQILPRDNALVRPAVANVDQALVIFAAAKPKPHLNLLDRFLIMMQQQDVPCLICFNKEDLVDDALKQELVQNYINSGYEILFTSAECGTGIDALKERMRKKTTTVAGPSGVGKSSLINLLAPDAQMETGEVSKKIERGKHTTRHAQLIYMEEETYIIDTPGFSSLEVQGEAEELKYCFPEFDPYEGQCRFLGCNHLSEPDCAVKEALSSGKISQSRYDNYGLLFGELKERRKY